MRVAFFGLPLAALTLRGDGAHIVLAALSRPGAPGTRRLTRAIGASHVFARQEAEAPEFVERIRSCRPDLVVSWFWTRRIPPAILEIPRLGAIGVHPSLLPRHRGPDPYFWAIECGDEETGVTAHRLDQAYDTGPILAERRLSIDSRWNAWTLAKRLDRPSLALLRDVVAALAAGRPLAERAQDEALATAAPEPDDELLELSWQPPAERIVRRIRAAAPWPGAYTRLGDVIVTVTEARLADSFPRALVAGEAAVTAGGVAVVRAGEGAVALLAGRDEDDAPLDAGALAALVREAGDHRG